MISLASPAIVKSSERVSNEGFSNDPSTFSRNTSYSPLVGSFMTQPSAVECTPFPDSNLMDVEPSEKVPIIDPASPISKDAVVPSENATS